VVSCTVIGISGYRSRSERVDGVPNNEDSLSSLEKAQSCDVLAFIEELSEQC